MQKHFPDFPAVRISYAIRVSRFYVEQLLQLNKEAAEYEQTALERSLYILVINHLV